jgi:hypothetical protein
MYSHGLLITYLRANDIITPFPSKRLNGFAHCDFGISIRVARISTFIGCSPLTGAIVSYLSAVSKKLTPHSYACFMHRIVSSKNINHR